MGVQTGRLYRQKGKNRGAAEEGGGHGGKIRERVGRTEREWT